MMLEFSGYEDDMPSIASYDISVIPNDFNVLTINSLIESSIILMPNFQRNYVWEKKRASKFIESLILGLPVPQIFLYQVKRNEYSIIDGQQRLLTIYFFIRQRFPKRGKRTLLRKIFNMHKGIPDKILLDDNIFQDFKLQFPRQENGKLNPLHNKTYTSLDIEQKNSFELMPIRCMSIRQNRTENEDSGAIYEIFSRLNTGGLNLSPQEIRGCLYASDFYKMIYELNSEPAWRDLLGKKEEDDKFRDVEVLLRSYALLERSESYSGSMMRFLNQFSQQAKEFDDNKIQKYKTLFCDFLTACSSVDRKSFLTKTGSFNVSLFDAVFVVVVRKILSDGLESAEISQANFDALRIDSEFQTAITHSTSHHNSIRTRIKKAQEYLYGNKIGG